jgi:hypothetical protein
MCLNMVRIKFWYSFSSVNKITLLMKLEMGCYKQNSKNSKLSLFRYSLQNWCVHSPLSWSGFAGDLILPDYPSPSDCPRSLSGYQPGSAHGVQTNGSGSLSAKSTKFIAIAWLGLQYLYSMSLWYLQNSQQSHN